MESSDEAQLRLFGAGPGPVMESGLTIAPPREGKHGEVRFVAWTEMRRDPMHIRITSIRADQMSVAVGYVIPLALMSHWCAPSKLKAHIWQVYRRLGIAGWEVEIRGCGQRS